jgi:hypothetical protein
MLVHDEGICKRSSRVRVGYDGLKFFLNRHNLYLLLLLCCYACFPWVACGEASIMPASKKILGHPHKENNNGEFWHPKPHKTGIPAILSA